MVLGRLLAQRDQEALFPYLGLHTFFGFFLIIIKSKTRLSNNQLRNEIQALKKEKKNNNMA